MHDKIHSQGNRGQYAILDMSSNNMNSIQSCCTLHHKSDVSTLELLLLHSTPQNLKKIFFFPIQHVDLRQSGNLQVLLLKQILNDLQALASSLQVRPASFCLVNHRTEKSQSKLSYLFSSCTTVPVEQYILIHDSIAVIRLYICPIFPETQSQLMV